MAHFQLAMLDQRLHFFASVPAAATDSKPRRASARRLRPRSACVISNSRDQPLERARFFERIEVLALDVLDQRHRDRGFVGHAADDGGNFVQARDLRGAPAALAGDDLVARAA